MFTPRLIRRTVQLLAGLFLYGFAIGMMVRAGIGVSPWDVFAQGLVNLTGIPFGWITNIVGALVLLLWIPIRQKPGVGTLLNVLLIGPSAEVGLAVVPEQTEFGSQILVFAGGLALLALATGLYIGGRFGPGPRDGLMTGLHRRTGLPIWLVRGGIELTVIGPMVDVTLPLLRVPEEREPRESAVQPSPRTTLGRSTGLARKEEGSAW
jgi:uncharacterized membrane protein YczE